jgi:hypothetical protein
MSVLPVPRQRVAETHPGDVWINRELARRAKDLAAGFADGQHLTYGRGGKVHATGVIAWIGDEVLAVVPLCHSPALGGPGVAPRTTTAPVDCLKCTGLIGAVTGDPAQPVLDGINDLAAP